MTENVREFPDSHEGRERMAEVLAEEVRDLRRQLDEVPAGPRRRTDRKRILLQIDTRRWNMGLLNPKKYGKKLNKADRLDIFKLSAIGGRG